MATKNVGRQTRWMYITVGDGRRTNGQVIHSQLRYASTLRRADLVFTGILIHSTGLPHTRTFFNGVVWNKMISNFTNRIKVRIAETSSFLCYWRVTGEEAVGGEPPVPPPAAVTLFL